jgi:hypothetical protein
MNTMRSCSLRTVSSVTLLSLALMQAVACGGDSEKKNPGTAGSAGQAGSTASGGSTSTGGSSPGTGGTGTGGTTVGGAGGGAGGEVAVIPPPNNAGFVAAGNVSRSANFVLYSHIGPGSGASVVMQSPSYRMTSSLNGPAK